MDTNAGSSATQNESLTRFFPHVARVLLGLMFLMFGLNGFLNFMPVPKDLPEVIVTVSVALKRGGFLDVVSGFEVLIAIMLLANRFVPLALAFLAPIIVGILTFHIYTSPQMIVPGIVVALLELYLVWSYRKAFHPMLAAKMSPG